ncbi:MAG: aminomethyltransferase family protein [Acidobacteriota bacterium]
MAEFIDQYEALRTGVGWRDRSAQAKIEMNGDDRARFLNGMLTNDVKSLAPGQGCYAAMLSVQGKVLFDVSVLVLEDRFLLETGPELKTRLLDSLNKYIIMDQVEMRDVSDERAILTLVGPASTRLLTQLLGQQAPALGPLEHRAVSIAGKSIRIVRNDYTGTRGWDVWMAAADRGDIEDLLMRSGAALGLQKIEAEVWNLARIEAGRPLYGTDMDENFIALEAGLEDFISMTKGCYIGQEVVVRILHMGHVNRKLVGLRLGEAIDAAGRPRLYDGAKKVGFVTSAGESPILGGAIGLGYVRREASAPGTTLSVNLGERQVGASVAALPFFKSA